MGCGGSSTAKVGPTAVPVSEAEKVENDIAELRKTFDKYALDTVRTLARRSIPCGAASIPHPRVPIYLNNLPHFT